MALRMASCVFLSLFAIFTSCKRSTSGQPWRWRNSRRDAGAGVEALVEEGEANFDFAK